MSHDRDDGDDDWPEIADDEYVDVDPDPDEDPWEVVRFWEAVAEEFRRAREAAGE